MKDGLYHPKVWMPDMNLRTGNLDLLYSEHALTVNQRNFVRPLNLPKTINFARCQIVEVEVVGGVPVKVVARMPYDMSMDICMPIRLEDMLVKTVWLNRRGDNHITLDRSKYVHKPR